MHLVYYDEAGDDGFPGSSPLFVLTAFYCSDLDWKENFKIVADFKHQLAKDFSFPFKEEMHAREFLLNKSPYHHWDLSDDDRVEIAGRYCQICAQLIARVIVTAVIKPKITLSHFPVLDKALSYSIQRVENDLGTSANNRFLIITDEGRVGKIRSTSRRMQRINYVPSKFGTAPIRREIKHLIEDPLPKNSRESYFIQLSDLIGCLAYFYLCTETGAASLPARMPTAIDHVKFTEWLDILKPILNLKATSKHPYGFVCIPA
jgi:hypothetical protein